METVRRGGPRRLLVRGAGAALVLCMFVGCALFTSRKSQEQTGKADSKADITAGGNVWNFNFQSVTQQAGWGATGLACIGWGTAALGRRRERRDFYKLTDGMEDTNCDVCKGRIKKLRDARLNARILKRYHPKRKAA